MNKIKEGIKATCDAWWEEMKNVFKDQGMLIFFILVPVFYPLLYSWIYNNEMVRDVPVVVVDNSNSSLSRSFIRAYDASPDVKVAYQSININEAKTLIGKQLAEGIVVIPADFHSKIERSEQSTISVFCNMSIMLHYKAIYQAATNVAQSLNQKIQIARSGSITERDEQLATSPLNVDDVALFNSDGGYADFIIPGVLILILHQTLLLGIGLSAGTARERGLYANFATVNRRWASTLFGKALCYFMIYTVMAAYITMAVPHFFGFVQMAEMQALIGLMIPFLLASIFFAMIISNLIRHREDVMLIIVFTTVPLLFLSGMSWPEHDMPPFWQGVAWIFPSTFGIRGFVRVNIMGATLRDIRPEYIALWIQTIIFFFVNIVLTILAKRHNLPK